MNTKMASARYALPFNSHAHLQHVHDQQIKQEAGKSTASAAAAAPQASTLTAAASTLTLTAAEPRVSTGVKMTRKMQSMFGGKKEQRLARADRAETEEQQEHKQSLMRRLIGDGAMMHSHRSHLGRP